MNSSDKILGDKAAKFKAIVPIKEHSSRVPDKNFRRLGSKPLHQCIIDTLLETQISEIIINTDSPEIKNFYRDWERITVYSRPTHLIGDDVSMNKIILDTLGKFEGDYWLQTHVTNPLVTIQTINDAIKTFQEQVCREPGSLGHHGSMMSVNRMHERLYDIRMQPINHDPSNLIQTQDLDPIYLENSCLYLFTRSSFMESFTRIGRNVIPFPIDRLESVDIDYESDFELVRRLLSDHSRTAIVTGTSQGIGKAIAIRLLNENWYVIGLDKSPSSLDNNRYTHQVLDLTDTDELVKWTTHLDKTVDLLVNNAAYQSNNRIIDTPISEWDKTIQTNLTAPFVLSRDLHRLLRRSDNACIINIASVHSFQTSESISAYAMTKGGIVALTRAMALEYARDKIRVNAISPGAITTPMLKNSIKSRFGNTEEQYEKAMIDFLEKHPLKRPGMPDEIADTVIFLYRNRNILGQNIVVDGGVTTRLSTE